MNSLINFIHIPKTAGTSFRNALEQKYGVDNVVKDYSPQEKITTSELVHHIYSKRDFYGLESWCKESANLIAIAGHYQAIKYGRLFELIKMVTFVREPVSRIISEYNHFKRNYSYKKSLLDFAQTSTNINGQSKRLIHVPYSSIGLIGITERYEESLSLLNSACDIELPVLVNNVAPNTDEEFDDETIDQIKSLNEHDVTFYNNLLQIHDKRMHCVDKGVPYSYGQFQLQPNGMLLGWVFQKDNTAAITMEIYWDNIKQLEVLACEYNLQMKSLNSPRNGFIAFHIKLPKEVDTKSIDCVVQDTGQSLVNMIEH